MEYRKPLETGKGKGTDCLPPSLQKKCCLGDNLILIQGDLHGFSTTE